MKMFGENAPLMRGLAFVFNLVALNMLFILCCLPVVTIGASCTALHVMARKINAGDDLHMVRNFFRIFAQNFRQATLAWLPLLAVGALLYVNVALIGSEGIQSALVLVALLVISLLYLLILLYIFPLIGRYANTLLGSFRNALLVSIRHLPRTVLLAVTVLAPAWFVFYSPAEVFVFCLPFMLLVGFSGIVCVQEKILAGVFRFYDGAPRDIPEE